MLDRIPRRLLAARPAGVVSAVVLGVVRLVTGVFLVGVGIGKFTDRATEHLVGRRDEPGEEVRLHEREGDVADDHDHERRRARRVLGVPGGVHLALLGGPADQGEDGDDADRHQRGDDREERERAVGLEDRPAGAPQGEGALEPTHGVSIVRSATGM